MHNEVQTGPLKSRGETKDREWHQLTPMGYDPETDSYHLRAWDYRIAEERHQEKTGWEDWDYRCHWCQEPFRPSGNWGTYKGADDPLCYNESCAILNELATQGITIQNPEEEPEDA